MRWLRADRALHGRQDLKVQILDEKWEDEYEEPLVFRSNAGSDYYLII
jgi:hypothetical protein